MGHLQKNAVPAYQTLTTANWTLYIYNMCHIRDTSMYVHAWPGLSDGRVGFASQDFECRCFIAEIQCQYNADERTVTQNCVTCEMTS